MAGMLHKQATRELGVDPHHAGVGRAGEAGGGQGAE